MTLKKSILSTLCLTVSLIAFAESKVLKITKQIEAIEASAGVNVIYKPTTGENTNVTISGDAKRIEFIDVKVSGKTLEIQPKHNWKSSNKKINGVGVTVTVSTPIVCSVEASSGATVKCTNPISSSKKKISLEASSAGRIVFASLTAAKLDIEASSGASVITGNLNASHIELEASSGASVKIAAIKAERISCEASSAGSISITSGQADRGDFEASSAGSIKAPALKVNRSTVEKSSAGSIKVAN